MITDKTQITTDITDKKHGIKLKLSVVSVMICVISVLIRVPIANAQTDNQIMTVIPPRLEVQADPGKQIKKTIQFRNEGEETTYLSVTPKDFIVKSLTGTPEFVTSLVSGRWAASSWIKATPGSLAVPPKATVNINLTINVPKDALPGGHYAGILYESSGSPLRINRGTGAGTGVNQVVGTLLYITVSGPINEQAMVTKFEAPEFSEYGPVNFTTEILNQSDIHISPKGQITIRDMFGKTVKILPIEDRNIFPGASLIYQNVWEEINAIGRYRADLTAAYGSGRAVTATIFFWVFPWKVVTMVLLAILLVILLVLLITRQIRQRQEVLEEKLLEDKEEIEKLKEQIKKK